MEIPLKIQLEIEMKAIIENSVMIKKFNQYITEADGNEQEISEDKVKEVTLSLKETAQTLDNEKTKLDQLVKDLEFFTSQEDKNDQIDDSYISLQEDTSLVSEAIVKIGEINTKMDDYIKKGRDYLY